MLSFIWEITAKYMSILFFAWIIYILWAKKDQYIDIILYGIYATILGIFASFIIGFYYLFESYTSAGNLFSHNIVLLSYNILFMISMAMTTLYFGETRKTGIVLMILGIFGVFAAELSGFNSLIEIYISVATALLSSIIIYYFKDSFNDLNRIIKAAYYILR